jgi:hypothetical protein
MIVMSTHGRTGLARWRYGSVAAKVLVAARCPVLLVHSQLAESFTEHDSHEVAATTYPSDSSANEIEKLEG